MAKLGIANANPSCWAEDDDTDDMMRTQAYMSGVRLTVPDEDDDEDDRPRRKRTRNHQAA